MAKYRTLAPVTYVADGKAVQVKRGREIELSDEVAKKLADKVVLVDDQVNSMFPEGTPIIDPTIVRTVPATPVAGEPVEPEPEPAPESKKAVAFRPGRRSN